MANEFGSDFMTIVDEDGEEYELEVLSSLEYNGNTYLAVIPAGLEEDEGCGVAWHLHGEWHELWRDG